MQGFFSDAYFSNLFNYYPIVAMARLFFVLNRSFEYCDLAQIVATETIKPII
jgi:hypothetical protein